MGDWGETQRGTHNLYREAGPILQMGESQECLSCFSGWSLTSGPSLLFFHFFSFYPFCFLKSNAYLKRIICYYLFGCAWFQLWHVGSLVFVVACGIFCCGIELLVAACGTYFPDEELNPGPLHWEHRALATGPPGKSPPSFLSPSPSDSNTTISPFKLLSPSPFCHCKRSTTPGITFKVFSWTKHKWSLWT